MSLNVSDEGSAAWSLLLHLLVSMKSIMLLLCSNSGGSWAGFDELDREIPA